MKKLLSTVTLASTMLLAASMMGQPAAGQASTDAPKGADIRRLMEILGSDRIGPEIGSSILQEVRPALERMLPAGARRQEVLARLEQKLQAKFSSAELSSQIVAIYDERLTHKEILEFVEFYQGPLGQRMLEVMPAIMQEAQGIGTQWGEEAFQQVITEMEAEFPELRDVP